MDFVSEAVENIVEKGEDAGSYNVFKCLHSLGHLKLELCGNPLPDNKLLDWSKLNQIADDILNCIQNGK